MMKSGRLIICILAALCLLLSSAGCEAALSLTEAYDLASRGAALELREVSLLPANYSGITVQAGSGPAETAAALFSLATGVPAEPVPAGDGSICSFPLPEAFAREILEKSRVFGLGPDGAVLRAVYIGSQGLLFVQRDKTLTPLTQAANRGAADERGNLKTRLNYMLTVDPDIINGDVRWSPDGRYLFINDSERWFQKLELDDPFLADTHSGEIFLLETANTIPNTAPDAEPARGIQGGRFSRDGRSFFYICRTYGSGAGGSSLKRYNLDSGETETCFESGESFRDLAEMGDGQWLLLAKADSTRLIRLSRAGGAWSAETEDLDIRTSDSTLYPVSDDLAILLDREYFIASFLLPVRRDSTGPWLKVRDLSPDGLCEMTADELKSDISAVAESVYGGGSTYSTIPMSSLYPDIGRIESLRVVDGTDLVVIPVVVSMPGSSNWPGRRLVPSALVALDTETMKCRTLAESSLPDKGTIFSRTVYGNTMAVWSGIWALAEKGPDSGALPEANDILSTPDGEYEYRTSGDTAVLVPLLNQYGYVALTYTDAESTVTVSGDGWQIRSVFTRIPEPETRTYLVPEALTEARYEEIKSSLPSKKDTKKFQSFYTVTNPEKLSPDELEELLTCYPGLADGKMYILKNSLNERVLETLEALLAEAGYTEEDYRRDSAAAAVSRGTNTLQIKDRNAPRAMEYIPYRFPGALSDASMTVSRMTQLASLCDRINSAVYTRCVRPEGDPSPVADQIAETYELAGVRWNVVLESAEENGDQLIVTLTAVPEQ